MASPPQKTPRRSLQGDFGFHLKFHFFFPPCKREAGNDRCPKKTAPAPSRLASKRAMVAWRIIAAKAGLLLSQRSPKYGGRLKRHLAEAYRESDCFSKAKVESDFGNGDVPHTVGPFCWLRRAERVRKSLYLVMLEPGR
jgi:hypothetical protein